MKTITKIFGYMDLGNTLDFGLRRRRAKNEAFLLICNKSWFNFILDIAQAYES